MSNQDIQTETKPTIDHIGILVADLDAAIALFTKILGMGPSSTQEMPDGGVRIAMFDTTNVTLEFLQYLGGDDQFAHDILGEQMGINHFSLEVGDLGAAMSAVEGVGAKTMAGFPRQGAHGQVAFFEPETTGGVRFELCQPDPK